MVQIVVLPAPAAPRIITLCRHLRSWIRVEGYGLRVEGLGVKGLRVVRLACVAAPSDVAVTAANRVGVRG